MKKLFCILLAAMMLSSCAKGEEAFIPEAPVIFAEKLSDEPVPVFEKISMARLDGGKTFASWEGFTVRYFNEDFELIEEIELFAESIKSPSECVFSSHGIFMENETSIVFSKGEWKLSGGAIFDRGGEIIREFPAETPNEKSVRITRSFWLGEDILVFVSGENAFFYRISEDKIYPEDNFFGESHGGKTIERKPYHNEEHKERGERI